MTPKPLWLAALVAALPLAAPAARAAAADYPTVPKCLAHTKALCSSHHPACVALGVAMALCGDHEGGDCYVAALMPDWLKAASCAGAWVSGAPHLNVAPACPQPACHPDACPPCRAHAAGCGAPVCTCVPAGAATPCWAAGTCWQPPVLPPPVAVTPPMPCPAPGCFPGTTPAAAPMTVCAEPMPVYVPCCGTSGPAPRHYVVEMKLNRAGGAAGRVEEKTYQCMTAEGAPVQVVVCGAPDRPAPACLCVCLARAGKHKVGVEMNFECCHACKCGKDGERMQCDGARVCRTVAVGKPAHVVLRKGAAGAEEAWVEVTVTEAPHAGPERIAKAPKPMPPVVAPAGMTLPSGKYVNHPPQYIPPSPAFPLTRELATQEAVWMPAPPAPPAWPGMMIPAPMPVPVPVMAVPAPAPARPAAGAVVRAVSADGKAWLEVRGAGAPWMRCKSMVLEAPHGDEVKLAAGKGRVVVHGPDMTAWADGVRTAGRHRIVLEGHVRLVSHHEGHESRVKADVLEVSLKGNHVEVLAAPEAE